MKRYVVLILCSLTAVLFTSCDSLWNVTGGASVDFSIDFNEIARQLTNSNDSQSSQRAVAPSDGALEGEERVFVGIYDAKTNALIASEALSLREAQQGNVSFNKLPVKKEVYALIRITMGDDEDEDEDENESELLFRARSLDTTLKNGKNTLNCKPNLLFFNSNGDISNSTVSNILSGETIFDTFGTEQEFFQSAYDYMSIDGEVIPDATLLLLNNILVNLNETQTWDFPGLTLLRGTENGNLIHVNGVGTLVLKNITIDGNSDTFISNGSALYLDGVACYAEMYSGVTIKNNNYKDGNGGGIYVYNADFTIHGGTVSGNRATNGGGIYVGSGTVTVSSGTISENKATQGGGVYVGSGNGFTLEGGTITGNHATRGGGIDIVYGTVFMYGGIINKNTTVVHENDGDAKGGAGVFFVGGDGGNLYIKGDPFISDNFTLDSRQDNLLLGSVSAGFYISEKVTSDNESIGIGRIDLTSGFKFAQGYSSYTIDSPDKDAFFSDNPAYRVQYDDGGAASPSLELVSN